MENPIQSWRKRHMNPTSFWLHMFGIPACFIIAPILLLFKMWWLAAAFFVVGYIVQFVGHGIEGNESGEEMLFRRIFNKKK